MAKPKKLTPAQILGEKGVNLIGRRFLEMGFPWHPTNAPLDAGIDGHVELRDPSTGEATNTWLAVQSKARTDLENESETTFEFTCTPRDLDYWFRGNMPVLLVVSRPRTEEAWWVSVKDYFQLPGNRGTRKIYFDKSRDALDNWAASILLDLAQTSGSGAYFRPAPIPEQLDLNLLALKRLPTLIYRAETTFRNSKDVSLALREVEEFPQREWFLSEGAIYSVHDLRDAPWSSVCDIKSVESIAGSEWAESTEPDTKLRFVWLLNECLRSLTARMGMRATQNKEMLYFKATKDLSPRVKTYMSRQHRTNRDVFKEYRSTSDPSRIWYYRHCGFEPWFKRFDGQWCLQINPTYLFTSDGHQVHPFHADYLSKIKSIEGSGAVGNQVVMYAALLQDRTGLFARSENYPHLGFGDLLSVNLDVGINDHSWSSQGKSASAQANACDIEDGDVIAGARELQLSLFNEDEVQ